MSEADNIRSQHPQQFNQFLDKIKTNESSLTIEQNDYYQYLLAYQYGYNGDFYQAQAIWEKISETSLSTELKFRANLSLINIFAYTKQWSEGLTYLENNLKNLHLITNPEISQLGISAAAIFYNQLGQYELALKYANQLNLLEIDGRNSCIVKQQIIESKFHLKTLNINSEEIKNALNLCLINNEIVWFNLTNTFIAKLHLQEGMNQKAIDLILENIAEVKKSNYIPILSQFYSLLSKSYLAVGEVDSAKFYGNESVSISGGILNSEPSMIAYEVLYQVAVLEKDFETALLFYIKFAEAEKSYFDDLKTKYLAFQLAQHKAVEQKVQIELLNKQNKLLKASQRLADSETENNRLFMALLIMVISLLAIAAIRSNRNQKRLRHLAEYDSLTQIYNRGHFTSAAQDAIVACQTNQDDISCILFDLDKFKTINDNYGHACGDWVLKTVASTCKSIGRKNDIFARLGGEEFCIILSRCDANTAMKIAEDYRRAIAAIDSTPSGKTFPITASFGVTDSHQSGYSLEALTGHADNAMYLAKDTGRNQVCNYADVVAKNDAEPVVI
ncbi:GGDEF domain-containing protein [Shewanella sp. ENK2]|uniref:GGDEF domain-containing protein n=1 Tax=Shewanella sp. ENK2 TaxID=2775245 RepID=UPI003749EBE2